MPTAVATSALQRHSTPLTWGAEASKAANTDLHYEIDSDILLDAVQWTEAAGAPPARSDVLLRVLDTSGYPGGSPALLRLITEWTQQDAQRHHIAPRLWKRADAEGVWLLIGAAADEALILSQSLQHHLCAALDDDVFIAFVDLQRHLDAPLRLPQTWNHLHQTALAARLMHATEPVACERAPRRAALNAFRQASALGHLRFALQPIVEASSLRVVGHEMLARMHPNGQPQALDNSLWIPYVTHSHDSLRLGHLAVMHASEALQKTGPTRAKGAPYLSINLTALNFLDTSIGQRLLALPERARRRIVLELTEWKDPRLFAGLPQAIAALQAHGIRVAIDDFGAGYSSTAVLRHIRFDLIKLDLRLVQSSQPSDRALIEWTLQQARHSGATVVAEGVESEAILRHVRALGIPCAQGFFIDTLRPK